MSPLQPEEIRLLTEVGFLAGARGNIKAARSIFGALERCRPLAAFPYIGMAMALLNVKCHDEAVRVIDRALAIVSDSEVSDLQAVRALALRLAGRSWESERAIQAAGSHAMALALATTQVAVHI